MTTATSDTPKLARWLPALVLLAAGTASALLLWSRRDYVPIFDGRIYADCIQKAAANPGYLGGYRCGGHIAESYVAILAFAARLVPESPAAMLAANTLLFILGAVALWRLARSAFPSSEHRAGWALIVGAFLVHPVVLAAIVQPGLDNGLLVFSLCALAAAVENRRGALVFFGILLVFAKEPGVVLYGMIAAVWLWRRCSPFIPRDEPYRLGIATLILLAVLSVIDHELPSALFFLVAAAVVSRKPRQPSHPLRPGFGAALRHEWPLAVPVLLLAVYMLLHVLRAAAVPAGAASPVVWGGAGGASALLDMLLRGGLFDPATRSMLALTFLVGFLWVPSLWLLADLGIGVWRYARLQGARAIPGADASALQYITIVLLADVWLLSRFVTFSNARYYLPIFPLALIAAYAALVRLRVPALGRAAAFGLVTVLLAVSAVRTVDPVSRALWGTFPVGDHSMLSITSLRNECCGNGRDQLAYNLEFTQFASLQDELYQRLKPTDSTTLVVPPEGDWFTVETLDSRTHRRTMRTSGTVRPRVVMAPDAYDLMAPRAWYVELPFVGDTVFRRLLRRRFDISEPCHVHRGGYALAVREMRLRSSTAARPSIATQPTTDIAGASPCSPPESALSVH
jgi:hypothetical protein